MGPDSPLGTGIGWLFGSVLMLFLVFFIYSMGKLFHENQYKNYVDKSQIDKPRNKLHSGIIFILIIIAIFFTFVEAMK